MHIKLVCNYLEINIYYKNASIIWKHLLNRIIIYISFKLNYL